MKRQFTKFAPWIKSAFVIICFFTAFKSTAQVQTYRVFFKDKGPVAFEKNNSLYNETHSLFNERALERRRKVLPEDSLITLTDAPVYAPYVDSLRTLGANILLKLRWKNYAVVEVDSEVAESFKSMSFVNKVQRTGELMTTLSFKNIQDNFIRSSNYSSALFIDNCGEFGYGRSYNQAQIMNVPALHAMGFTGKGALTGFLDNGFRWRTHNALKNTSVVAEYDFIFQDSVTENEAEDVGNQDGHGTPVLATVAGFLQDSMIGIAPMADFLLGKTEDMRHEKRIEEDNYAAGVEWMESLGADVISSSLGYYIFDETDTSYIYDDLTGSKTITAQAVNHAVSLGVVCVTAAGNDGSPDATRVGTISTPGDADSVITVAAVNSLQVPAGFSSRGPLANGKIKPDIAAQGVSILSVITGTQNLFGPTSGTSFSTPITAGNMSLLLSAFPELRPWEARNILYSSGSQATAKDNILGYGIPDMVKAFKNAGIAISPLALIQNVGIKQVFVSIVSDEVPSRAELYVRFAGSSDFQKFILQKAGTQYLYYTDIPTALFNTAPAEAYVVAQNSSSSRRMPFKGTDYTTLDPSRNQIPCGINPAHLQNPLLSTQFPVIINEDKNRIRIIMSGDAEEKTTVRIYNIIGQLTISTESSRQFGPITEFSISTGDLPSGTYIVYIERGSKLEFSKFVINR